MTMALKVVRFTSAHKGYVFLATLSLGLSVGVSTVAVGIGKALWWEPAAVKDPATVVMVLGESKAPQVGTSEDSFWTVRGIQRRFGEVRAFEDVAGQVATSGVNSDYLPAIEFAGAPGPVEALGVTWNYFSLLGLHVVGRAFTTQDDQVGAEPVAIISDRLWRHAFGRSPEVIGGTTDSWPLPLRIVGVAPEGFQGIRLGERVDAWIPQATLPRLAPLSNGPPPLLVFARLRSGASSAGAERELSATARPGVRDRVVPIRQVFGSPQHRTAVIDEANALGILSLMAVLVLCAGCATVMALIVVHYERRGQELGIRLALGCSWGQVLTQVCGELAVLALTGTACALFVATLGLRALPAVSLPAGADLARLDLSVDWRLAAIAVMMTGLSMTVAAAVPLLRLRHVRIVGYSAGQHVRKASSLTLRRLALGIHMAATVVLLVGASLMLRTIHRAVSTGAGFDIDRTVFVRAQVLSIMASGSDEAQRRARLAEAARELTARLASIPGVEIVALGDAPIGPDRENGVRVSHSLTVGSQMLSLHVGIGTVDGGYTTALGLPLLAGRQFSKNEVQLSPPSSGVARPGTAEAVALVSRALADRLWGHELAIGNTFQLDGAAYRVVGVVGNCAEGSLRIDEHDAVYVPTNMAIDGPVHVAAVARTRGNAGSLVDGVRRAVQDLVPVRAGLTVQSGRELVSADLARQRLGLWFFLSFGIVALILGTGSLFGLVAYFVESRRRESGIRIALGCTPASIVRMFVVSGSIPGLIGGLAGLLPAVAMTHSFGAILIDVRSTDLTAYAAAEALVVTSIVTAATVAAFGAIRTSPMDALRAD